MKYYNVYQSTTHKLFPINQNIAADELAINGAFAEFRKDGHIVATASSNAFITEITEAEYNWKPKPPEPESPFFHKDNLRLIIFLSCCLAVCLGIIICAALES